MTTQVFGRWPVEVDLLKHPLDLHDPSLRFVLAVEAADGLEAALCRFQTDAERAVGLRDQLQGWDCHGRQHGTRALRLHPEAFGFHSGQ